MMSPAMFASRTHATATPSTAPAAVDVEVTGLTRAFGAKLVLRGVSLSVARGHCLTLLGPNGAGKTTLLRVLATLNRPDAGRVCVAGYDVARDAAAVRRVVGYVGHQPHVYEELTAAENLVFFARMYGLRDASARAEKLLDRVGLRARAADRARTLSRGQLQRLALARGILHEPRVLLLDEPDTGLDEAAFALLRELVAERKAQGRTTVLTTHHLERGLALGDDVAVLARGRIGYTQPASELDVDRLRTVMQRLGGESR
jgi:heme ABC exporter ATP-binding subunit CcmA